MKKATKIWLLAAASLVVIGCIVFGGVMAMLNWDFTKLSTSKYETTEHEVSENYKNISIISDTADIQLIPSNGEKTLVVCREQEHLRCSVTVEDSTLKIQLKDTRKWYEYIGINFGSHKITVYLPEAEYGALYIKESTGKIKVPETCFFESIDITASTGSVKNFASASGAIKIKTSTGSIHTENISAKSLHLSVSTGKVIAKSVSCKGSLKVKVSTGNTQLTDIRCGTFTSAGTTGDLMLKDVIAEENFSIQRDTGDVKLDKCDAASVKIETSTGDVKGTLLSEKVFIVETDTGKTDVPETVTGGKCKITTDTGDIKIKLS